MRREITRWFTDKANHAYTCTQESATAEEKETDVRLRSTASDQEAVIELKIGDNGYSGKDLKDAIFNQLVTKYMAPESRRAGCFVVTIAVDRTWKHPETGASLDADGLESMLKDEVARIQRVYPFSYRLAAKVLDLRPPLPIGRIGLAGN